MKKIEEYVRSIPDFPEPGIIFRDVTSILQDADGLKLAIDSMQDCLKDVDVDVIVGTESRGFIFGMPIAYNLHKSFASMNLPYTHNYTALLSKQILLGIAALLHK